MTKGFIHQTNSFGEVEIVDYKGALDVTVKFMNTGSTLKTNSSAIRSGKIKDMFAPIVSGFGFHGVGKYSSLNNRVAYKCWNHMIDRCYSHKQQKAQPTYKDCTVCDEWRNFQVFAEWYYSNYPNDGKQYFIDKDLTVINNKIYSSSTCMFVTRQVNSFAIDHGNARGALLIGVSSQRDGVYVAICSNPFTKKKHYIGSFTNEVSAHLAWRKYKITLAEKLIESHDREEDKNGLMNYIEALNNNWIHKYNG